MLVEFVDREDNIKLTAIITFCHSEWQLNSAMQSLNFEKVNKLKTAWPVFELNWTDSPEHLQLVCVQHTAALSQTKGKNVTTAPVGKRSINY